MLSSGLWLHSVNDSTFSFFFSVLERSRSKWTYWRSVWYTWVWGLQGESNSLLNKVWSEDGENSVNSYPFTLPLCESREAHLGCFFTKRKTVLAYLYDHPVGNQLRLWFQKPAGLNSAVGNDKDCGPLKFICPTKHIQIPVALSIRVDPYRLYHPLAVLGLGRGRYTEYSLLRRLRLGTQRVPL